MVTSSERYNTECNWLGEIWKSLKYEKWLFWKVFQWNEKRGLNFIKIFFFPFFFFSRKTWTIHEENIRKSCVLGEMWVILARSACRPRPILPLFLCVHRYLGCFIRSVPAIMTDDMTARTNRLDSFMCCVLIASSLRPANQVLLENPRLKILNKFARCSPCLWGHFFVSPPVEEPSLTLLMPRASLQ